MKTKKNNKDQFKSGGAVPRIPKSILHVLRSFQPAKTLFTYLLLAVVVGSASLIAYAQSSAPTSNEASVIQGPGLRISGTVRIEDLAMKSLQDGLEGVEIYMSYLPTDMRIDSVNAVDTAIPPTETPQFPDLIAVTDENGEYESGFIDLHDEGEIHVWAVKEGFQFEPEMDVWFHAYGYEEHESNFIAIPDADITITPTPWATNTPPPPSGVVIFGTVQLDDSAIDNSNTGLEGVEIYMAFASYPGSVVAVTDQNGCYESDFVSIAMDETIRVWAEKDGYRFVPEEEIWRFYAGTVQERQIDFLAYPEYVTVTPITPTFTPTNTALPPGVIVFGEVLLDDPSLDRNEQGVADVEIHLALASYQGSIVDTTDSDGRYSSAYIYIPGDEMIRVWPVKEGYRFEPQEEIWRHYAGHEIREINFLAYPDDSTVTPITPTFTPTPTTTATPEIEPGLRIYGNVELTADGADNSAPGLGGVDIYLSVDGSGYKVVAVTNENGYYDSGFISLSGEHQIIVWAVKDGYLIEPEAHRWTHLDGYEVRRCDFIAAPTKPGLVVNGYVWKQDDPSDPQNLTGVSGVDIFLSISGQSMGKVAVTDENGFYETGFFAIEGEADMLVWPEKEGYTFVSQMNSWRHYPGYEERRVDFLAVPEPGLVVYGSVQVEDPDGKTNEPKGLEGVDIYLSVDGSGYRRVARTDAAGNYRSDFIALEGEHGIILWAVKDGYIIEPEAHRWTHAAGYEERRGDFFAKPEVPGVVVSGGVWLQDTARADNPNWEGIPGVRIRMSISGRDIGVIAITNQEGEYASEFIPIDGAAEVSVWPELAGYEFVPEQKTWQHAAGDYEEQDAKFLGYEISTPTPIIITPTHTPTTTPTPIPTYTPTATPEPFQGLVVYGTVRRGGISIDVVDDELAGFEIYVGIGPGVPTLVAITNNYGEYNSGFIPLGESASINVFAIMDGYTFIPEMYSWLHPNGFEQRQCNFDAYPDEITPTPTPTSTPIVIPPDRVFVDVPEDHPYAKYIQYLYEQGFVSGCTKVGERAFCPDDPLTRAQQAVILVRARHPEEPGYIPPSPDITSVHFGDVQEKMAEEGESYFGTKYIQMLFDLGLTNGCNANPPLYCPDIQVTRGEMVTFAVRLRNGQDFVPPEPTEDPFNDVPRYLPSGESNWVAKWAAQGLVDGIVHNCGTDMDGMFFFPEKDVTRAEMACMVYHALTNE